MYVGGWKSGCMHGKGLMVWSDGRKFYGEYQRGMKHGQGLCVFPSGDSFKGIWFRGKLVQREG